MLAIRGIYNRGRIVLQEKVKFSKPVKVIITFLEDIKRSNSKKIDFQKFSFSKSRELLKDYKGSLSDTIIEERRSSL
jgi:hypothetical protein